MKANLKLIKKKRYFSEDFQRELVTEFEKGKYSIPQLSKLHGISNSVLYRWVYKFSIFNERGYRIIEMNQSSTSKLKQLEQRIKELERTVGQKQIKIDFLDKMIDIAKEELDIDIKKNYSTSQSSGSGRTNKK